MSNDPKAAQDIPSAYCTTYYKLLGIYVRLRTTRPKKPHEEIACAFDDLVNHRKSCIECQEHMRAMTAYAESVDPWHMPDLIDEDMSSPLKDQPTNRSEPDS